jgi:N-acetylglutamate synthase-like GNAT family acetyltransferase
MSLHITAIDQADYASLAKVLAENNLLTGDLESAQNRFFAFEDNNNWRVGVGGLEIYGDAAILRSFLTVAAHRGTGLGGQMLEELLGVARRFGISDVYLFTVEAEEFFAKHQFERAMRENAPFAITASRQFIEHCNNATFMHRALV